MSSQFLSCKQAAQFLGISSSAFRREVASKLVRYRPTPNRVLFSAVELSRYMQSRAEGGEPVEVLPEGPNAHGTVPIGAEMPAANHNFAEPLPSTKRTVSPKKRTHRPRKATSLDEALEANPLASQLLVALQGGGHVV